MTSIAKLILLLLFWGSVPQGDSQMDNLTLCKLASYASEMAYDDINELMARVNSAYAFYLPSSGWSESPNQVRFVKVYHIFNYYFKNKLYKDSKGQFLSDEMTNKVFIIDSFLTCKFGPQILQSDSLLLKKCNELDAKGEFILSEYVYMIVEGQAPLLISKNGTRNQLNYYNKRMVKSYYSGYLFNSELKNADGELVLKKMRDTNLLMGYPVVFPDTFKRFFTIDNKPTQLFLPDTCFTKSDWEEAWRYKPDY